MIICFSRVYTAAVPFIICSSKVYTSAVSITTHNKQVESKVFSFFQTSLRSGIPCNNLTRLACFFSLNKLHVTNGLFWVNNTEILNAYNLHSLNCSKVAASILCCYCIAKPHWQTFGCYTFCFCHSLEPGFHIDTSATHCKWCSCTCTYHNQPFWQIVSSIHWHISGTKFSSSLGRVCCKLIQSSTFWKHYNF